MPYHKIVNRFNMGMNQDAHPSRQPEGTYRYARNASHETLDYSGYGLSNQLTEKIVASTGSNIIGYLRIEERNSTIFFVADGSIRLFNHDTDEITRVATDSEFGCYWGFDQCKWIGPGHSESKVMTHGCKELHIYWSSNCTYWTANIDALLDPKRRTSFKCDDFLLLKCGFSPRLTLNVNEGGGGNLPPGQYFFAAQLEDLDGSSTNWFFIEGPVYLCSEHNDPGVRAEENSPNSVRIKIDSLDKRYHRVNLAVIPSVNGVPTEIAHKILSRSYNSDGITFDYYSTGQHLETLPISEILGKRKTYLKGCNLFQKDGRLWLYRIKAERNLNYQRRANKIQTKYRVYAVPAQDAWKFKGLRRDEVYAFGIQWKYCDGTYSPVFHIPGREADPLDCVCDGSQNDARRTETLVDFTDKPLDLYCFTPAGWTTENENNIPQAECIDPSVDPRETQEPDDCVDQTTNKDAFNDEISGIVTDNDSLNDCLDCAVATTDPDLDKAQGFFQRILETLKDLIRTDKEVAEDCSVGTTTTIVQAATELYEEGIKFAEKDEEFPTGTTLTKQGATGENLGQVVPRNNPGEETPPPSGDLPLDAEEESTQDDNCVKEVQPTLVAKGDMGSWASCETYPLEKDCDGEYMYGEDLAGKPIRHHRIPSADIEPTFISYQTGVESRLEPENLPENDTYVFLIGVEFNDIEFPQEDELAKPLNETEPYRIVYVKREAHNKSVIGSGIFTGTFEGVSGGKTFAVPRNAVNSSETIDRSINDDGDRRGQDWDEPLYNFHSPDISVLKTSVDVDYAKIDLELYGAGMRYGLYGEGEEPENRNVNRKDRRGARQAVNLNRYVRRTDERHCVTGSIFAEANKTVKNPAGVDYQLLNKYRESSTFLQTAESLDPLTESGRDGTSDLSFIGDGLDHTFPVARASAWYGSLKRVNACQYGSVEGLKYADFGLKGKETSVGALVGDSFVQKWSLVRTSYISDKVGDKLNVELAGEFPLIDDENYLGDGEAKPRGVCDYPNRRGFRLKDFLGFFYPQELPESGDQRDPKNMANLHPTRSGSDAVTLVQGGTGPETDIYFPRTLSTLIHLFVETDVNLHCRTVGEAELGEIFYEKLQGEELDSSINDADDGFLDTFHAQQLQPSKTQKSRKGAIRTAIVIGIPALMGAGIAGMSTALEAAATMFISPFFAVMWLFLMYNVFTGKKLDRLLGIPECKEDEDGAQNEDTIRRFQDNFFKYNWGFSAVNDLNNFYGIPQYYNTCDCLHEDTEILMADHSRKKIKDVSVGDYVKSYDTEKEEYVTKKVLNVWDKGILDLYEITFSNRESVLASIDHKWFVKKTKKGGSKYDKSTHIVTTRDLIENPKNWYVLFSKNMPSIGEDEPITNEEAYILGVYIAEGSIPSKKVGKDIYTNPKPHTEKFFISQVKPHIREKIKRVLDKTDIEYSIYRKGFYIKHVDFVLYDCMMDVGKGALNKRIPEYVFKWDISLLESLYEGLLDGDGYRKPENELSKAVDVYYTASDQLAEDVKLLSWLIGKPMLKRNRGQISGFGSRNDHYVLCYSYSEKSKLERGILYIKDIKLLNKGRAIDIEVEDTKSFILAKSGAISHNCDDCEDPYLLNEIYISDKQILGSAIDAYRNFKSNQYLELPSESGDLLRIFNRGGRVLAHTSDGLWQLRYGSATIDTSEGAAILGQSDLLAEPIRLLEGVDEGYLGTTDPNAAANIGIGYAFVDSEGNKIYLLDEGAEDITVNGMRSFFRHKLDFCSNGCKDQLSAGGTHYTFGMDYRHNVLYFTKHDGGGGYTATYDVAGKKWISFHDRVPQFYFWDRGQMYSVTNGQIYKHNQPCGWNGPFEIEIASHYEGPDNLLGAEWFNYINTVIDSEVNECGGPFDRPETFNRVILYNQFQTSGPLELVQEGTDSRIEITHEKETIQASRENLGWRFNEIFDRSISHDASNIILASDCEIYDTPTNYQFETKDPWMRQKWLKTRLTYDGKKEFIFKQLITNVQTPEETK